MLRTPPFLRAPILLFRRPAVLITVIAATAILGMVAALTPLFLSSASSAALQQELQGRCPASFGGQTINFAPISDSRAALTQVTKDDPAFLPPRLYLEGGLITASNTSGEGLLIPIRFAGRDEFRDHIELIEGEHGPGAYIDDVAARDLAAGPGDIIEYNIQGDLYQFEVQAVYRGLYDQISDPYWCLMEGVLEVNIMGDLPPPIVLVDTDYFDYGTEHFQRVFASYARGIGNWELPIAIDDLTVPGAEQATETLRVADESIVDVLDLPDFFLSSGIHSDLPIVTQRVTALASALQTSIIPLAAVVLLASIALVGGAGSYWVDRRKLELQYLSALGVGPGAVSLKATLEFIIPMLIGGAAGWGLANAVIPWIGPSPDVDPTARVIAIWTVAGAVALSLTAVALIVSIRTRSILDHKPRSKRSLAWRIPVMIAAVAGAILVRARIGESAVVIEENQLVGSVDPLVLLLPILTITASVLLIAEVVIRLFPVIRRMGAKGHSTYLASRRIVSAPTLVIALIAGAALPVATLVYSASLTRSATSTIDAKGKTFIGADIQTPVFGDITPPGSLEEVSTIVIKTERASFNGEQVDVLAIDGDDFARGAFWEVEHAEIPLETVLGDLADSSNPAGLDAYLANGSIGDGDLVIRSTAAPIQVVAEIESFPGARRGRPLLVVDKDRFVEVFADDDGRLPGSRYLMWTLDRTEAEVESELKAASIGFAFTTAAATTLDQLRFAALIWTFDFLEIYSYLAGFVAIGAVLLYVDTRQRARNLSYALARRMGLTRREHLIAGFLEIGALALIGVLTGVLAGRIPARQLYRVLDAVQETPPPPRWIGALDLTAIAFAVGVLVTVVAGMLAQRTADAANTSELLRHGE
ncbi:MAG: ABC transporter permease [Actinobacteria bacterium]|nr:MAG: ABC transporter permease [Actinomycetota bacterium]